MTMKLSDILNINNVLKKIIEYKETNIDPLLKFKLLGVMKNIEIPVSNYEKVRGEKIMEYGEENPEEKGMYSIAENDIEARKKFEKDMNSLINTDVDVFFAKLKPEDVFDKGLPAEFLVALYPIIEE